MTYELLGYASQADFDNRQFHLIQDSIENMEDATEIAYDFLSDYPIIKVQSADREEIKVIKKGEGRQITATLTETLTVKRVVEFEVPNDATEDTIWQKARELGYQPLAVTPESPWEISDSDGLDVDWSDV